MTYKYCLYQRKDSMFLITLSNNFDDVDKKDCIIIYDVRVQFVDGDVIIEGIEDRVYFEQYPTKLVDLKYTPRKEDVKMSKKIKFLGITLNDSYCYVKGWYRTEPIDKVKYTFKNYAIKEIIK